MLIRLLNLFFFFLSGCASIPAGIAPVKDFDVSRYPGRWYEIARLDHSFERGLQNVTADYALNEDMSLAVLNRGYDPEKGKWKEAKGRAYFIGEPDTGALKVTFFWPFYGGYNIIDLDKDAYSYALVCGPDLSYLWILSRNPVLDEAVKNKLVEKARILGFDTDKLIFVKQQAMPGIIMSGNK